MSDPGREDLLWPHSVTCLDVTLASAAENLALDEVLLNAVENSEQRAYLRFWQPRDYAVIVGRSNQVAREVDVDQCAAEGIAIHRRSSGGGTVLIGPGCLCYSLVLPLTPALRLLGVSGVTASLMSRSAAGLTEAGEREVEVCGTSDLVWNGLKFSGNAQRWLRQSFIHHGTLLHDFDLPRLDRCLRHPSREPDYRQSRRHGEFVGNIATDAADLKGRLASAWNGIVDVISNEFLNDAVRIANTRSVQFDQ